MAILPEDSRKREILTPVYEGDKGYLLEALIYPEDGKIDLLIPVEGDHPMLVTVDFVKKTYTVEGYD